MNNVEIDNAIARGHIRAWLAELSILDRSRINDDGTVDVQGHVYIPSPVTVFRGQFGSIKGTFYCNRTSIKTLKGAPHYVSGDFLCNNTEIDNLNDAPKYVGGDLLCHNTNVRSLRDIHLVHPDWEIKGALVLPTSCANILSLALIPGINRISLTMNSLTPHKEIDVSKDIFEWQEKLLELGLVDQARP